MLTLDFLMYAKQNSTPNPLCRFTSTCDVIRIGWTSYNSLMPKWKVDSVLIKLKLQESKAHFFFVIRNGWADYWLDYALKTCFWIKEL